MKNAKRTKMILMRLGLEPRRIAPPGIGVKVNLNLAP